MKKCIFSVSLILTIIMVLAVFIPTVHAVEVDSINFYTNRGSSAYDIRVVVNGGTEISTTYRNNGYYVYFSTTEENEK